MTEIDLGMKTGGDVKDRLTWWECACGMRVRLTEEQIQSKEEVCPQCGALVGVDQNEVSGPAAGDTQLINIGEMAQMAQDGVDLGVSGEWDTQMGPDPSRQRDDDYDCDR
jgi:hypothetical protein